MSILAIDVIDRLPVELAAALLCDPFFNDIPVVVSEKGNVVQEIQRLQSIVQAKGGKWGVAVVVLQLVADDDLPEVAFGSLKLRPAFQVIEQPTQNNSKTGTGKSARKVARKIRDVIKPLALAGLCSEFVFEQECIQPVNIEGAGNCVGYHVHCHTYEVDDENIAQVSAPQFTLSGDGLSLVITTATVGAVIYFTTDDSFPAPADLVPDSTAVVYATPVAIPAAGFTVRAIALPGSAAVPPAWINSQVSRSRIFSVPA